MKIKMLIEREIQDQGFPGSVRRLSTGVVHDLPDTLAQGLINAGSAVVAEDAPAVVEGENDAPESLVEVLQAEIDGIKLNIKELEKALAKAKKADKPALAAELKAEEESLAKITAELDEAVAAEENAKLEAAAAAEAEAAGKAGE